MRRVSVVTGSLALMAIVALGGCASSSHSGATLQTLTPGVLKACLYPGFAPVAVKEGDTWAGWDVQFLQGFADEQGLELQPVAITDFNNIWARPGQDECDVAGTGIAITSARTEQTADVATWSDGYYSVARSFVVRNDSTLNGVEDLAGKTVIVTKGSTAQTDLEARLKEAGITNTRIEFTDDEVKAAQLVAEADANGPFAYGGGEISIDQLEKEIPKLKKAWSHCLMHVDGTVGSEIFSFPVRNASTGVLEALNAYISNPANPYPGGPGSGLDCPKDQ